jgi:hypothetical protein
MNVIKKFACWVLRYELLAKDSEIMALTTMRDNARMDTEQWIAAYSDVVKERDAATAEKIRLVSVCAEKVEAAERQRDNAVRLQTQDAARIANAMTALQMVIAKDRLDHAMGPTGQLAHHPQALR